VIVNNSIFLGLMKTNRSEAIACRIGQHPGICPLECVNANV